MANGVYGSVSRLCLVVASLFLTASALAGPSSSRLTYERSAGAESCPAEAALRHAVELRLGYDPFFPWADRTIVARIRADSGRLRGTVELVDHDGVVRGTREVTAPPAQCSELVAGMALAISIAIDPSSVDRAPKPPNSGENEDDPDVVEWRQARAAEPPDRPAPAADRPRRPGARTPAAQERSHFTAGLGVAGAAGQTPGIAFGPTLRVSLRRGAWSAGVEARYLFGTDAAVGAATVSSTLAEAALLACFQPSIVFVCAEGSAGRLGIAGHGITNPRDDATFVARVGPRAGVEIPLTAVWTVIGSANLAVDLGTQTVQIDGGPSSWVSSRFGGGAEIAAGGRFP